MDKKDSWKVHACAWLGTAAAVIVAIYITRSPWCLLALYFPTDIKGFKRKEKDDKEEKEN